MQPSSHGSNVGEFVRHWHVDGVVVALQKLAFVKQPVAFWQEQGGCPVMLMHVLPTSHASNVGALKLHSQKPALQVSAFSGQPVAF